MLTGELNFDEVFKPEESRPFELAALTIYLGSIIVVTIVVGNLLIGLTVDDVSVSVTDGAMLMFLFVLFENLVRFLNYIENFQGGGFDS